MPSTTSEYVNSKHWPARQRDTTNYNIYKNIFDLYAHYQTDSAQVYIDAMTRLPEYKSDVVMQATLHIAQAEIYAVSALYTEAISELEKVPHSLINHEHADL